MTEEQRAKFQAILDAGKANYVEKTEEVVATEREEFIANLPKCQNCQSDRLFKISSHGKDMHGWEFRGRRGNGYAPFVEGICGGDDTNITVCLECGQLQGTWPNNVTEAEIFDDEDEDE